jgi:hypothetical protein
MVDSLPIPAGPGATTLRLRAAEWLSRAEQEARAREDRRRLRHTTGIHDDDLLERLRRMGVTPETVPVLELVPAMLVGWSDGALSRLERDRLRALAIVQGIAEAHPAWPLLQHWMLERPLDHEADALLAALHERLDRLPPRVRHRRRRALLTSGEAVARAFGPTLGGPKVSREEREMLSHIESRLG